MPLPPKSETTPTPKAEPPNLTPAARSTSQKLRRWVLELGVVGLIYLGIVHFQTSGLLSSGEPAPDFSLRSLSGQRVQLKDYRGKKVLLHFWATWCGACKREISMLKAMQESLPEDVVLLSVVADGNADGTERIEQFVRKHQLNYPVLLPDKDLLRRFKVNAFPTNYVIDSSGRIQGRTVGLTTRWGLKSRLGCAP